MSLFKERVASSRKIIALENEIINLKQKLSKQVPQEDSLPDCDCDQLQSDIQKILNQKEQSQKEHQQKLSDAEALFIASQEKVSLLKADLKKVRSENTRLKKKLEKQSFDQEDQE